MRECVVLLDDVVPDYEFSSRHRVWVGAPPGRALKAAERATPGEMPLVRLLFALRSFSATLARKRGLPTGRTSPLLGQMLGSGFTPLAKEPGLEVVAGVIAAPWKVGGSPVPVSGAAEFVAFDEPGHMKGAMNFSVEPADGGTELRTETRVLTTDSASRRAFGTDAGLPDAVLSDPPVAFGVTNGVYAAFAFAAATGVSMLAHRWPRRARLWAPLALAWAGSGSLFAWGLWQTATMGARPELGTPLLAVVMPAKVLAAALAGAAVVSLLRERFGPAPGGGACPPLTVRHDA